MKPVMRMVIAGALVTALSGCSIGGLLGGGGKAPTVLQTLSPEAPDPGAVTRTAAAGQSVTVAIPLTSKELHTVRVPVQISPGNVQYVTNLTWIDTPDRLFQSLVAETIRRTTNRVVLDNGVTSLDPGLLVSGQLQKFGYDASTGQVAVEYDGALSTSGGNRVETRRFVATAPADGTASTVGPALNRAANEVARDVAGWVGNSG